MPIRNLSIVLVGQFNPSIITPHWLSSKKAIRESEAENAKVKIIHPEISDFKISFAEFQVSQDKFIISCNNEADFDLAKDLTISIFSILSETPVSGIGLNHIIHFGLNNAKQYNSFGDWLSPHKIWEDQLDDPKLMELKIVEPFSEGNPVKNMVSISISEVIKQFGVRYLLNYHIEISKIKEKSPANIVINHWEKSITKSNNIFNSLISKFDG
ncbi:MAG: hypothetical protein R3218_00530 [Christiangramia sp.]|nr:hypothetical protein [Christiangramia sp.]